MAASDDVDGNFPCANGDRARSPSRMRERAGTGGGSTMAGNDTLRRSIVSVWLRRPADGGTGRCARCPEENDAAFSTWSVPREPLFDPNSLSLSPWLLLL